MFYFNTLNLNQISGGNQVKQGDFGSTFSYKLADEKNKELDAFDQKTAYVNLVLKNNIVFSTTVTVNDSKVTFNIDKAIPTGLYFLEIKIDSYIFPSDRQTIILVTAGAVAYDLKDLIPNYDVAMTITDILSDLSQKGIDIRGLKTIIYDLENETTAQLAQTDGRISGIIANAGDGTLPSEVVDMRVIDNKTFETAGDALRESAKGSFIDEKSLPVRVLEYTPVLGEPSKNLFNKETAIPGLYAAPSTGAVIPPVDGSSPCVSDWIPVKPNTTYTLLNVFFLRGAVYDADHKRVASISSNTFETPANGYFVRINVNEAGLDVAQMELGNVQTPYEKFGGKLESNTVGGSSIVDKAITEEKLAFKPLVLEPSKNLFNKDRVTRNRYIEPSSGTLKIPTDGSIVSASDWIPVQPNTTYTLTNAFFFRGAIFNDGRQYVQSIPSNTFTTPDNGYFVRINVKDSLLDSAQLEEGAEPTGYETFGYKLPPELDSISGIRAYDEEKIRLILPPKMFFVEGESIPLYKSNIFADISGDLTHPLKTAIVDVAKPRFNYFYEDVLLNPDELSASFQVGVKQYRDQSYNYHSDIKKLSVSATSNQGKTPAILNIGDSLTNRNIPQKLRDRLVSYGVNPTMIGTMANAGGVTGEGREGWEFENFIGMDNTYSSSSVITRQTTKGKSSLTQNPFLKLATETDKTSHPNWCFRNTSSNKEMSYADSVDKTGDFYIFDFNYYLTTQKFTVPDVVTIALSTNDIWQSGASALSQSRLSLEIMITQIKKVNADCKIGIIPAPAWGSNDSGNENWIKYVVPWIEKCMTDVLKYQADYTGLDIVPVWCHLNRDFNFPYSTTVNVSDANQSKKAKRGEYVHWGESGKLEYINVLSAYVMNVI